MFDKKKFLDEIRAVTVIALFIFVLAVINLCAKTNDQILSAGTMEMAGYVTIYNSHYDEAGTSRAEELKQIEVSLESDKDAGCQRQFYILDKGTGEIICTGDAGDQVSEELNSQVNEKTIIIDNCSCKVVDFDHFKLLVKMNTQAAYNEFISAVGSYALLSVGTLACAFVVVALGHKLVANREAVRTGINIVITLAVVATFAGEALYAEMSQLDTVSSVEQQTLEQNLEAICNQSSVAQQVDKAALEEVGNAMAGASSTLGSVAFVGDESHIGGQAGSNSLVASRDVQVAQDEGKLKNERVGFYIQAALLMLLALILANETRARAQAAAKADAAGAADLTANDRHIRTIIMLVGLACACFDLINVLRIRQVVMANWTDNIAFMISAIFTATTVVTVFGSLAASAVLKRCGSVKTFAVVVCGLGAVSACLCGLSNNVIVFVAGLLVYNIARTGARMSDDFYATTIDDRGRKDRCSVEFNAGKSIGKVVGTIAGGIVCVMVSFSFVQVVVGVMYLLIAVYALRLSGEGFDMRDAGAGGKGGVKESFASVVTAARHPSALLYMTCVAMMGSVSFMLVQYKLPLDIAALGLSTVVLSFIKTLGDVIEIYSRSLFHVVSHRVDAVTHAVLFVVSSGAIILIYMLAGGSLVVVSAAIALLGMINGAGIYAITKAFRELPDLADMPESDRIVALRLAQKAGDTISSPLLSIFHSGPVLPVIVMALPSLYLLREKRTRRAHADA